MDGEMNSGEGYQTAGFDYAVDMISGICRLAAVPSFVDDVRSELRIEGIVKAVRDHETAKIFDWLVSQLSFQGISDDVALGYIQDHGNAGWGDIRHDLQESPTCPKLKGYWAFEGCRYQKGSRTCSEPDHIDRCPLPRHNLRNGRLNQIAYSLFLFIRDAANGDLVAWIDDQLDGVADVDRPDRLAATREAIVGPLRNVFGLSDKVLGMTMSTLLMGTRTRRSRWFQVGASFVVIDTLVHNLLHRTGILQRLQSEHPYGPGCYAPDGCADILHRIATKIDAAAFNPAFPTEFPRFVQSAVWRYAAQNGVDVCNGNRINDNSRCDYRFCRVPGICDRVALHPKEIRKQRQKRIKMSA
jgi:hypothetical protein